MFQSLEFIKKSFWSSLSTYTPIQSTVGGIRRRLTDISVFWLPLQGNRGIKMNPEYDSSVKEKTYTATKNPVVQYIANHSLREPAFLKELRDVS